VYVPANDELAFAAAIDGLLDDAELRHKMGQRGRTRLEKQLSWKRSRHQLIKFYEQVFAARR
jgi:glycosyltransferase involved in cell wall biosynthesis